MIIGFNINMKLFETCSKKKPYQKKYAVNEEI